MQDLTKEELDERYDRKSKLELAHPDRYDCEELVKESPLFIEHGFENTGNDDQDGEPMKFDFRGIEYTTDFHVYAPEATVRIGYFDPAKDGGITVWIQKDWMDDNPVIVYWNKPTQDQIAVQEITGIEHVSTPNSREKREGENR